MNKMLNAATVIIPVFHNEHTDDDLVYVVTRKTSKCEFGLPGGKQDPGETVLDAAIREVKEELNLTLSATDLVKIYEGPCYGDVDFNTTTFLHTRSVDSNDIITESGIECECMPLYALTLPTVSPFSDYNSNMLGALREHRN